VNERWVCKRCFADNEESDSACQRCGLIRGAEATSTDQAEWSAQAAAGEPATKPSRGMSKWLRFWWIPALVIVLAVGYFASARRGSSGELENAGTLSVGDLHVGDCFDVGDEEEISDVDGRPCTEAHEFQVFHVQDHQTGAFPSDAELEGIFSSICASPFESFVGEPYASSVLYGSMITPSESSWADGDREYVCVLYDPENTELTTSMEGANR
jgi:hypothetical protein